MKIGSNADPLSVLTQRLGSRSSVVGIPQLEYLEHSANEHFVQFYETDVFLLDSLTNFIASGLLAGGSVVVVATTSHLEQLKARFAELRLDVAEMVTAGCYVSLDAEALHDELIVDGILSADKFNRLFSRLIERAFDARRPIRVFAELVALLWARGQYETALELEQLWDRLKQTRRFSVFCAYPLHSFGGNDQSELLTKVCLTHSRIVPGESYLSLKEPNDQLRAVTLLQQKAISLGREVAEHRKTEERLKAVQEQLQIQLCKSEEWLKREQLARGEAEAANRMKDEFLATVSHELRTPLNAIIGWSHMLNVGGLDNDTRARAINSIERNAQSQAQLVEDLLDVSRMISGELRLELASVDVPSVIKAAIDSVQLASKAKEIEMEVIVDPAVMQIVGDSKRLKQICWNLLSNAIKFTPPQGHVSVQVKQLAAHVELAVVDSGQGIPPEFLRCVFDRFRQADGTSTRRHGGLGLGLAIVRHLVELHGGEVFADSRGVGLGSTFVVRLPSATRLVLQRDGSGDSYKRVPPSLAGVRVLVVDDDAATLDVLTGILEQKNACVRSAHSAARAIEAMDSFEPDVFVLDLELPGEDGFSLLAEIRERQDARDIRSPAVALTAHVRVEDRVRALSAGFNMFVPKPVEAEELVAAIVSLLQPIK